MSALVLEVDKRSAPRRVIITPSVFDFGTVDVGETRPRNSHSRTSGAHPCPSPVCSSTPPARTEPGHDVAAFPLSLVTGETAQVTVSYTPVDGIDDDAG